MELHCRIVEQQKYWEIVNTKIYRIPHSNVVCVCAQEKGKGGWILPELVAMAMQSATHLHSCQ